jgi:spore maturation protein SpmB
MEGQVRIMMNALTHMSDIMIPMVIFWIVGYGIVSGVKVYETFLKGAKEGLRIVVEILPTLVGLMMAVGILRTSGFFDLLGHLIGPATQAVGLPALNASRQTNAICCSFILYGLVYTRVTGLLKTR